ncbi:MAG TPA: hypothetical protein PKM21_18870 [Anaerolineales bacterium]|nr:hypothetical protein [Anaerolineales bacterium]
MADTMLERIIRSANAGYGDDLVLQSHQRPNQKVGDTLAEFIAIELKETFDSQCSPKEQVSDAIRAMIVARDELESVVEELEKLAEEV